MHQALVQESNNIGLLKLVKPATDESVIRCLFVDPTFSDPRLNSLFNFAKSEGHG